MTKYREIIRLAQPELKLSQQKIALSCGVSKKTVSKVLKAANEKNVSWPLPASYTDAFLEGLLFPGKKEHADASKRRTPDYEYVRKELLKNGVNKKLLWTEYLEECRLSGDNPNAEGTLGNISTWITAALRNEQFFSLAELNTAIRKKLEEFSCKPFQKKEGSRYEIFRDEELPLLAKRPAAPYELAEWKTATVQFNYHISVDGMLYSVPYEYIKRKVDVRVTETTIEIFYNKNRIASHRRLRGRKGQYSTVTEHMPEDHQKYLE